MTLGQLARYGFSIDTDDRIGRYPDYHVGEAPNKIGFKVDTPIVVDNGDGYSPPSHSAQL